MFPIPGALSICTENIHQLSPILIEKGEIKSLPQKKEEERYLPQQQN
jgi:hypothetical protein